MKTSRLTLCISLFFIFQFSYFNSASCQESDFVVNRQRATLLPDIIRNISFFDSNLYCNAADILLKVQRRGNQIINIQADTTLVKLDEDIDYVTRHPSTGDIYFTCRDKKGRSYLFCCHEEGKGKVDVSQVRMGGGFLNKGMTVEHPTFTSNGRLMVFSSFGNDDKKADRDLWYSRFDGKEWSNPVNLGKRINTRGDEINPFIYHGNLLFASNGNPDNHGHYTLYSTLLVADRTSGDTVWQKQIGRSLVQQLPAPFNIAGTDNYGLAADTLQGNGFWISNRDDASSQRLYSFSGDLEGLLLWGTVTDKSDRPLAGVTVSATQGGAVVCNTTSDENGHYRLYLHCNRHYDLSCHLSNYFTASESINTTQGEERYLITEQQHNIRLESMPVGEHIFFDDLFGPDADVELSSHGKETLRSLVQFLCDNPQKQVRMSLINDLTDDASFNSLLTERRILSLENHLRNSLPSTVKISIANGCKGADNCNTASGVSILTVLIDS